MVACCLLQTIPQAYIRFKLLEKYHDKNAGN